jgi:primosomal replication protein N
MMLITPAVFPATTPERFDANQVEFSGLVTRIWARTTGDIFARIIIGEVSSEEEDSPESGAVDARLTLQLPNGQVCGQDISLLKGDALHVTGYLSDITQCETLRDFLLKVRQIRLIERIPELAPAIHAQVKRMVTCVIPETLEVLNIKAGEFSPQSTARLEGVVARVWEYGGHLFVRLAVYDQHTLTTNIPGNNGRERRIPHYITVQFLNEQVDGRGVNLKPRDRIRVSGVLGSRVYSESLRSFLLSAHKADVLANLSDGQAPDEVWTAYVQTCLVAQKMIQYTKR